MSKFKVGDRVRTKGEGFLGTVIDVHTNPGNVVAEMDGPNVGVEVPQFPGRKVFWLDEDRYEKVAGNAKIVITTDGTTTLARLYEGNKVVKRAEAKCAPGDTFDFAVGANLAYDRLMRAEPEYYNGKIFCATVPENIMNYTEGRIYEVKDGIIVDDKGKKRPIEQDDILLPYRRQTEPFKTFAEFTSGAVCKWYEVKEGV
jgi:hypothetical protein